jgi:hypothetical protein
MHSLLYNCPGKGPQFCPALKIFLVFADNPGMKQFFQGLVLGGLLMYLYLNFGSGFLQGFYH